MSRFARSFGLMDMPNERSSHDLPTPRGGGVGILAAFAVASFALQIPPYLWIPAALLSLASFFDDRLDLSPRTRLIFQFAAAAAVALPLCSGLAIHPLLKMLLLFVPVFIVGTANFYNFMDGIDGIAGMTGVTAFALLAYFASLQGLHGESQQLLAVSAACLGFLPFNFPRARVFMGDVGSILLGFVFAVEAIWLANSPAAFLALAGCLFPFYADALSTLFVRWRDGETLHQAHRRHLYQILANQRRMAHWKISTGYAVIQAVIGLICIRLSSHAILLAVFLGLLFMVWCLCMSGLRKRWELA